MGTNTLNTATDGTVIPSTDHNSLVEALKDDLVPRDTTSLAPTDLAGDLGSSSYRWDNTYAKKHYVGTASNNNTIEEVSSNLKLNSDNDINVSSTSDTNITATNILLDASSNVNIDGASNVNFKINGTTKGSFDSSGLNVGNATLRESSDEVTLAATDKVILDSDNEAIVDGKTLVRFRINGDTKTTVNVNGLQGSGIADDSVERLALKNYYAESNSCGTFTSTSVSATDVTNLTDSITVPGGSQKIRISLLHDGSGSDSLISAYWNTGGPAFGEFYVYLLRSTTIIGRYKLGGYLNTALAGSYQLPVSAISFVDRPSAAGTYQYKIQVATTTTNVTIAVYYSVLAVYLI